ncbi:MAG: AI-2E family transporter [Planctomycetota bacterium]|nr:MAG: AI-2E family transporter [Planctomycetota bacterium]
MALPPHLPDNPGPRSLLQHWLPHLLLLSLVAATALLAMLVLLPLRDPILLAVSLAALTGPVLFEPCNRFLKRRFPRMAPMARQQLAGITATLCLLAILLTPFLALIINTVGHPVRAFDALIGIALQDPERLEYLFAAIDRQATTLLRLYPGLPFEAEQVRTWLESSIDEAATWGPTFLAFLFRGTSSLLAHLALAFIILPNCYAQGALAARFILNYTPLDDQQMDAVAQRHRSIVHRLLSDTVAFALCRGIALGGLGAVFTGLPIVPLILVATFLSLVPAIGTTMVWLPLVVVQWSAGYQWEAGLLAVLSLAAAWGLGLLRRRIGQRLDEASGTWLSFLLFLGIVGGLLSFGLKGFIIGPMVMVLTILVMGHLLPYYGIGSDILEDSPPQDPNAAGDKNASTVSG